MKNLRSTTSLLALMEKERQQQPSLLLQRSFLPERCLFVRRLRASELARIPGCRLGEIVWGAFNPMTAELCVITRSQQSLKDWFQQSEMVMLWVC